MATGDVLVFDRLGAPELADGTPSQVPLLTQFGKRLASEQHIQGFRRTVLCHHPRSRPQGRIVFHVSSTTIAAIPGLYSGLLTLAHCQCTRVGHPERMVASEQFTQPAGPFVPGKHLRIHIAGWCMLGQKAFTVLDEMTLNVAFWPVWHADLSRPWLPFLLATDAGGSFGFCLSGARFQKSIGSPSGQS